MLSATPERVLILEDDRHLSGTLEQWLWRIWPGAMVRLAKDLGQGLALVEQFEPQLLLADLNLPDSTDPTHTVLVLTSSVPVDVPIVIVSGYVSTVDRVTYLSMGADAVLAKDIENGFFQILCSTLVSSWARARGRAARLPVPARNVLRALPCRV